MTPVCSVCDRRTGVGEDKREPPVNLARCPSPGGVECRAVAQAVAPLRVALETAQRTERELRLRFGARDHETLGEWIERLATSTDEPDLFG